MADLKIPNLNMKSDKYIFKKKLTIKRKSKRRLSAEAALMFTLSIFLVYVIYLIPNKNLLLQNLPTNLKKSFILISELSSNLYEIFLVFFIFVSYFISLVLIIGSIYRIIRVIKRNSRKIIYK